MDWVFYGWLVGSALGVCLGSALVFWFKGWLDYYRGELYRFHHEKIGLKENKGGK